jgi:tyrosine-protein kinase Etk/Wzc
MISNEDSLNKINANKLELEKKIDIKELIGRILAYLPYYLVSIIVALSIAFIINRYSTPVYLIKSSILIKDGKQKLDGSEQFLQGLQLLSSSKNLENELIILKSRDLVKSVSNELGLGITYFIKGEIVTSQQYPYGPYMVQIDSNHIQPANGSFFIEFITDSTFSLKTKVQVNSFYLPKEETYFQNISAAIDENKIYKVNTYIESPGYKFLVIPLSVDGIVNSKDNYWFTFNTNASVLGQFIGSYNLRPITKSSSIIEITKQSTCPAKDIAYLDKLMEKYIQNGMRDKSIITQNTLRFIDHQLQFIGDSLSKFESNLQDFRVNNQTLDLASEGGELMANLTQLEQEKGILDLKYKYFKYLKDYLINNKEIDGIIAPNGAGIQDPMINALITTLVTLNIEKRGLELSYKPNNPLIVQKERNIQSVKLTLIENIETLEAGSAFKMKDLNEKLGELSKKIQKLPSTEQALISIERKFKLNEKLYNYLLEKRAEAGIAGASILADHKVIDAAILSNKLSPENSINYIIALVIGLLLPTFIVFMLEYFNNSVFNHSILQKASQIPLIGSIVHNSKNSALVIANFPKSQVSESFRNLRSNLNYLAGKQSKKVIMVTSTVSGEGKTFVSMNLSTVLAIGGYKTLLIGVDLRKPKIFQDFKLDNSFGLTNYLIGKLDKNLIIQNSGVQNLDVVTAGPTPPNPSELIMSDAFYQLINEYKEVYDYIILDTPPIGLVADGLDIMNHADIVLYVARQNVTKKNFLNLINEIYQKEKTKNIGLVFNDVNFAAVYGYGYGSYGYGYGYGGGYGAGYGYGYGSSYGYGYGGQYGYGDTEIETKPLWKRILGR